MVGVSTRVAGALLALVVFGGGGEAAEETSKPNLLWIITDDQRPDSLAVYNRAVTGRDESRLGYVSSPNIDRLASEGVLYTRAFCNSPACGPSRASMHTGRYPFRNGKYGWEQTHQQADFTRPTVSQSLRHAGYYTAIIGKRHYGVSTSERGPNGKPLGVFDFELDFVRDLERNGVGDWHSTGAYGLTDSVLLRKDSTETVFYADGRSKKYVLTKADRELTPEEASVKRTVEEEFDILRAYTRINTGLILGGVNPKPAGETIDAYIVEEFKNHLASAGASYETLAGKPARGANSEKPLFVNLGFHLPHTPVLPPKSFRDRFKDLEYELPEFTADEISLWPAQLVEIYNESKTDPMQRGEKLQAIRDYYAFTAYGDELVGKAVEAFKKQSEAMGREYVIVLTVGDHSWHLGEQGMMAKFGPWAQSVHGAAIVVSSDKKKYPPGEVCHELVEYVDFAPTLLAAGGVDVSADEYGYLDGCDLAQVLVDPTRHRDYILGEMNLVCGHRAYLRTDDFAFSMRTRDSRRVGEAPNLNSDLLWAMTCEPKYAELALYDLRVDPLERTNVAYTLEYQDLAGWFREKLGNIVLGDGRIEADWTRPNSYSLSNFAGGADDKRIEIPDGLVPNTNTPLTRKNE